MADNPFRSRSPEAYSPEAMKARIRARRKARWKRRLKKLGIVAAVVVPVLAIVLFAGYRVGARLQSAPEAVETAAPEESTDVSAIPAETEPTVTESAVSDALQAMQATGDYYPDCIYELVTKNPEALDFALQYPALGATDHVIDVSAEAQSDTVPLLIQWDTRWGYYPLGDGMIANNGCGLTCIAMVSLYLTHRTDINPYSVSVYAVENGYYVTGSGTLWSMMTEGCRYFDVVSHTCQIDEQAMKAALDAGCPIIANVGPGDFTDGGHYLVIRGYDENGFLINDPFSIVRSSEYWTYEQLQPQIKALWYYTAAAE